MAYRGHIANGVVVFDESPPLPEGMAVAIVPLSVLDRANTVGSRRDWKGIFRGIGPTPTEEDIAQMRRDVWPNQ